MALVTHIIDANTPADMLEQLQALRGAEEPVLSLGQAPASCPLTGLKQIHKPFICEDLCGKGLAAKLPAGSLIHVWSSTALAAASAAAQQTGSKTLLSLPHLPGPDTVKHLPWKLGQYRCSLTLPTEQACQTLLDLRGNPKSISMLPPAAAQPTDQAKRRAAVREELKLTEDEILMAVPVEMIRYAGHKFASWAHAIVRQIVPQGRLLFPGTGPLEKSVLFFAGTTGYDDEIFFTGEQFSRDDIVSAADVAMFFYERDCGVTPLAAAMAAGLPILACQTPDLGSICQHEQNALMVDPGDPRTPSAAMLRLIDQPELAKTLGENAQALAAEKFRPETVRKQLDEIYATCKP